MVAGVCYLSRKPTCTRIVKSIGIVSHDQLTRMLYHTSLTASMLMLVLFNQVIQLCGSAALPCWLIIDDVILPKAFSRLITGAYWDYDYVNRRAIRCHRLVVLAWTNGVMTIPVAFAFWHKKHSLYIKEAQAIFTNSEYDSFLVL